MQAKQKIDPRMVQVPKSDFAAYRQALSQFGTGVAVMTAQSRGELAGVTANSFASVSLDPPLVLWSLKSTSQSFGIFESTQNFAVNVLASNQVEASKKFGKSGPDKFDGIKWEPGHGGSPVLDGVNAVFECSVFARHSGGDHVIIVGKVEKFACSSREPLLFVQGRFSVPGDHPSLTAPAKELPATVGPLDEFLASLLYRAYGRLSQVLEEARQLEGFTLLQSRLLAGIETFPGQTLPQLAEELFLGENAASYTLAQLKSEGLVAMSSVGVLTLTASGKARTNEVHEHCRRLEASVLNRLPAADVAATRRVLLALMSEKPTLGDYKKPITPIVM